MTSTQALAATRIAALDIARGTAILGTFGTNVWIFTEPSGMIGYLGTIGNESLPVRILEQVAQGKFLGLLSLMFGVGLGIQQASARRHGRPWPGRYRRRAALLFADGLLHFLLVAEFDVLMGYAVVSLQVAVLLAYTRNIQQRWMIGASVVHLCLAGLAAAGMSGSEGGGATDVYAHGGFGDLIMFRIDHSLLFRAEAIFLLPLSTAMFLGGAALLRAGLFTDDGARLRRRLLAVSAVAAPLDLALGIAGGPAGVFLARYVTAPLVSVGLLALIAAAYLRRVPGRPARTMGAIGRTALSCYVLQNVLASALCYGWGFGLASRYGADHRLMLTAVVYVAVVAALCVVAPTWLRRFERGPIEALMHRLA
ncbi:DUF418 domain-containing protein [Tsukamurella sp. 8F]|uniref:DUF418 domain-containing protein n=1 Tax=unclassified Tsukamurella TaxID=2633480 RepID=UPI0023B90092|nr:MULTISPECIES: DUF418 domain-containing protein [unclassified Tsukamurella]MDF0528947.1 DUF418 domain-containing protein [Tsukamurella sp. 8J]MDF0589151.1 DUF418 domain-containing protein [Tsukamurella sp. 8F]